VKRVIRRAAYRLAKALGLLSDSTGQAGAGSVSPTTVVGEITSCDARRSNFRGQRLNLLLPSINARHYFGGIHTAVQLYIELAKLFPASRIVLTDSPPDAESLARFADHQWVQASADSDGSRQIVAFSDRYAQTLPVAAQDVWLSTAWWTTYAGQRLAAWQKENFGSEGRLINLIQDFEPGFYPWSSQSALALGTYRPGQDIGVFNTKLLADYFELQGLGFTSRFIFEPVINDGLREALAKARTNTNGRRRRMVVYARPSTPRNAFELLCEGLRKWGWSDPASQQWEVVAAGELTADIDLGPVRLIALGKLDLPAYAELLATSAIGVSIMVSPHPSYPPLEMAAFGMTAITNRFANKDLSGFSPNVQSFADFSPESIAASIASEVAAWESRDMQTLGVMPEDHLFLTPSSDKSMAEGILSLVNASSGNAGSF
jgi:hypothetical protein